MNNNQIYNYNRFFINEINYILKDNLIDNKFKNIIRISELMIANNIDLGSLSSSFNNNINKKIIILLLLIICKIICLIIVCIIIYQILKCITIIIL